MREIWQTILLLTMSNVFMTFAWYAHLKELNHKPWIIAALISWGIAFFEYLLQVPANRIGFTVLSVCRAAQNIAGSHYTDCFCILCAVVFKRTIKTGLSVGCIVHDGRSLFYVSHTITMRNIHEIEVKRVILKENSSHNCFKQLRTC